MRVGLHSCYLLHKRPYRETSSLLEVFSNDYGRCGLIAKGVRKQRSKKGSLLQAFTPLQMSWSGRGELKTLHDVEVQASPIKLIGNRTFCGFYVNELIIRLLHREDPHSALFQYYSDTVTQLAETPCVETLLRMFEKRLLESLGYGLNLECEIEHHKGIKADQAYYYLTGNGFVSATNKHDENLIIHGETIIKLAEDKILSDQRSRKEAKSLMRVALQPLLGNRPLQSRRFFR